VIAVLKLNQQNNGDRTFINPTYIYLIALLKVTMIAILKFNQQDDGDRTNCRVTAIAFSDEVRSPILSAKKRDYKSGNR